jgi:acyl-CoA reductase-like NAD-dependent aldehyde dehydrogenase
MAGEREIDDAVAAAQSAAGTWRDVPPLARRALLTGLARLVDETHLGRILAMVEKAVEGRAGELCAGGARDEGHTSHALAGAPAHHGAAARGGIAVGERWCRRR